MDGFIIANPHVLEAKEMAHMAIQGEVANIEQFANKVRDNPDRYPHELDQLPRPDDNIGLKASKRFQHLKESFFVATVLSGNLLEARHILKQIDRPFYSSLFKSFVMTREEENALILKVAKEYEESLGLGGNLNSSEIAKQLIGLTSFADFEDKQKLIIMDDSTIGDRQSVLKRLKRQRRKFKKLEAAQTLIGAALPDFRKL